MLGKERREKGIEKHDQIPCQSHGEYITSILPTSESVCKVTFALLVSCLICAHKDSSPNNKNRWNFHSFSFLFFFCRWCAPDIKDQLQCWNFSLLSQPRFGIKHVTHYTVWRKNKSTDEGQIKMTPRRQKVEVVAKISRIDFGEGKGINMKNGKSGGKMSTWLRD